MFATFFQTVQEKKKMVCGDGGGGVCVYREKEKTNVVNNIWRILTERDTERLCTIFATSLEIWKHLKILNLRTKNK